MAELNIYVKETGELSETIEITDELHAKLIKRAEQEKIPIQQLLENIFYSAHNHMMILYQLERLLAEENYWSIHVNRAQRTTKQIIDIKLIPQHCNPKGE